MKYYGDIYRRDSLNLTKLSFKKQDNFFIPSSVNLSHSEFDTSNQDGNFVTNLYKIYDEYNQ